MKKMSILLLVVIMLVVCVGCGAKNASGNETAGKAAKSEGQGDGEVINVIIACNATNLEHMYNIGLDSFKTTLEEVSGGKMTVTTHAGTIGTDESELVEKLQMGAADIVVAAPGFMTTVGIPEVDILSLYYLFDTVENWKKMTQGEFGDQLGDLISEKSNNQFKILAYWSSGVRNYYGKKEVKSAADLDGMTIRCQTASVIKEFWEECEAIPTSISWNELYQALEQGVVDSAENDYVSMSQKDHHKTSNGQFISETQHTFLTPVLLTTGDFYDSLTKEEQGWLDEAVNKATNVEVEATFDLAVGAKEKVIAEGATVVNVEDMDMTEFYEIANKIQDDFAKEHDMVELLDMVRSAKK